jgi:hypothetical protein
VGDPDAGQKDEIAPRRAGRYPEPEWRAVAGPGAGPPLQFIPLHSEEGHGAASIITTASSMGRLERVDASEAMRRDE